jgi:hypothetical protein
LLVTSCGGGGRSAGAHTSGTAPSRGTAPVTAAPDTNTPGDIPDTIAYVTYANGAGGYRFDHPEGWAQVEQGKAVTFTDKFNGVSADASPATAPPTPDTARSSDVPSLEASQPAFELRSVAAVSLSAGTGVVVVYRRNSPPDAVTGRSARIEVQHYEIFASGRVVTMELFGAVGADNVDPYRRMTQSLRIS